MYIYMYIYTYIHIYIYTYIYMYIYGWGHTGARQTSSARRGAPAPPTLPAPAQRFGILFPNNQRQHRTLHIQEDVLPYALC